MYKLYYYFGTPDFEFKVTNRSIQHANDMFYPDGSIYETNSLYQCNVNEQNLMVFLKNNNYNVISIVGEEVLLSQ